jgi:hypothetical protein
MGIWEGENYQFLRWGGYGFRLTMVIVNGDNSLYISSKQFRLQDVTMLRKKNMEIPTLFPASHWKI